MLLQLLVDTRPDQCLERGVVLIDLEVGSSAAAIGVFLPLDVPGVYQLFQVLADPLLPQRGHLGEPVHPLGHGPYVERPVGIGQNPDDQIVGEPHAAGTPQRERVRHRIGRDLPHLSKARVKRDQVAQRGLGQRLPAVLEGPSEDGYGPGAVAGEHVERGAHAVRLAGGRSGFELGYDDVGEALSLPVLAPRTRRVGRFGGGLLGGGHGALSSGALPLVTKHHDLNTRDQLARGERLHDVVVRAGVQPGGDVGALAE